MTTLSEQVSAIPLPEWRWQHLTAIMAAREMRKAGRRDLAAWYLSRRAAHARMQYARHEAPSARDKAARLELESRLLAP